jgi:predicted metal-dependent hydrolase
MGQGAHEADKPIIRKEAPRRSARCAGAPPPGLLAGIAQFNAGAFWDCHETLEDLWRVEPDHIRYLYQGLLQIGVGFYHLRRGNHRGAVNKLAGGLAYLAPSAPACLGVDVARLRAEAGAILAALRALGPDRLGEFNATTLPQVHLLRGVGARDGPYPNSKTDKRLERGRGQSYSKEEM